MSKKMLIISVLFVAAFGVRWAAILQNQVIANDAVLYIRSAQLYAQGAYAEGFNTFPRSIFPLFIAFAQQFVGDWVRAGQWVTACFGALAVIPFYFLAGRIFGRKIAIVSSIFYIVCPSLVRNSAEVLRDTPFVSFYLTALWLGYEGIWGKRPAMMALTAFFILLCASIKDYGLMLFPLLLLFLSWFVVRRQMSLRKACILCTSFLATAMIVVTLAGILVDYRKFNIQAPIILRAKSAFMGISEQRNTVLKLRDGLEKSEFPPQGKRFLIMALSHRFVVYGFEILSKTIRAFDIVLFVLFVFGLAKRDTVPYRSDEFLLLAIYTVYVPLFFLLLNFASYLQTKNTFPISVPSLIWSGVGFEELGGIIKSRMQRFFLLRRRWNPGDIGFLLISLIIIAMLIIGLKPQRQDKLELKRVGLWLRNNGYANSIILGRAELMRLAFYADSELIPIPKGDYRDIMRFARERKANLLLVDKELMDKWPPDFVDNVFPKELKRVDMGEIKAPKDQIMVFRIVDQTE